MAAFWMMAILDGVAGEPVGPGGDFVDHGTFAMGLALGL